MTREGEGSVTQWLGELKAGDDDAASRLWRRYFDDLVRLARRRFQQGPPGAARAESEDVALSAFYSLCEGASRGRFDRLNDRDDLWRLLVVITARKVLDEIRSRRRQKRGGDRVVREADLALGDGEEGGLGLDQVVGREPTPEFAALMEEEIRTRLNALGDGTLRQVALWRMEGYSNEEIAWRLGCVTRSVERKLKVIRKAWLGEGPGP